MGYSGKMSRGLKLCYAAKAFFGGYWMGESINNLPQLITYSTEYILLCWVLTIALWCLLNKGSTYVICENAIWLCHRNLTMH